jgi:hypothetical protein
MTMPPGVRASESAPVSLPKFRSWRDAFTHVERSVSVHVPALVSAPDTMGVHRVKRLRPY